jgi:hypothetical protein
MLPRQVLPRQFYLITRRCTQRQFLLRPDPATNNAFLYCLIDAARRCEIDVLPPRTGRTLVSLAFRQTNLVRVFPIQSALS